MTGFLFAWFSILATWQHPAQSYSTPKDSVLKVGKPAPTFALKDSIGADIFLRDFCGELRQPWKNKIKHVVILSFFATWCEPCLKEIPELEKLANDFRGRELKIFLVNLKEDAALVKKFCREKNVTLPVLFDKYGIVAGKYQATSLPRLFVVAREGKLIWQTTGYQENFQTALRAILEREFNRAVDLR
jgi:thiol-disulfide isomerase/thioredoxin